MRERIEDDLRGFDVEIQALELERLVRRCCEAAAGIGADRTRRVPPLQRESALRRRYGRNRFALVATVDPEIGSIDGNYSMLRKQFTHTYEAQISEIWFSIGVALGEPCELNKMLAAVKRQGHQAFVHHCENHGGACEVKRSFGENCLAG